VPAPSRRSPERNAASRPACSPARPRAARGSGAPPYSGACVAPARGIRRCVRACPFHPELSRSTRAWTQRPGHLRQRRVAIQRRVLEQHNTDLRGPVAEPAYVLPLQRDQLDTPELPCLRPRRGCPAGGTGPAEDRLAL
jgi:hypothetical protein